MKKVLIAITALILGIGLCSGVSLGDVKCTTLLAVLINVTTFDQGVTEIKAPEHWPDHVWNFLHTIGIRSNEKALELLTGCYGDYSPTTTGLRFDKPITEGGSPRSRFSLDSFIIPTVSI